MEPLRPADPRTVGGYQVVARLGSGGMGQVYLGRSAGGRTVAIKLVHTALAGDPEFRARFAREVATARAVSGAFTAPLIDAGTDAPRPWLVTAYLPGHSLQVVVANSGPLPPWSVSALGAGLAEALLGIHRAGVVHRDLKPSNVLLTPDGPRVIDFGVARAAEAGTVTRTGVTVGSPGYLPPEQATGAETGPAGDVFSLGAVLTYAATGHGPFGEGSVHELIYRVVHEPPWLDPVADPDLRELLADCLDKEPGRRPAVEEVLRRLAGAAPAPPYGTGWLPPHVAHAIITPRPLPRTAGPTRRRVLFGAVGVAGAAVLAGGITLLADRPKKPDGTWTFSPKSKAVTGGPALSGGLLFVTADYHADELAALDPRTGALRWTATGVTPPGAAAPLRVVTAGRIVYTCGFKSFTAIDMTNGDSLWEVNSDLITTDLVPVVGGGLLFSVDDNDGLVAYDGLSRQRRWVFNTGGHVAVNPLLAGGTVYVVAGEGTVYAVGAADGEARWKHPLAGGSSVVEIGATPVTSNGLVHFATQDKVVYALDAASGDQRWKTTVPTQPGSGYQVGLSAAGDTVYVADDHGGLSALGARDGKVRWRHAFAGTGRDAASLLPLVNGGLAYSYDDDSIFALDTATGAVRWRAGGLDGTFQHPVLAAGALHLASLRAVVSLDPGTGRVLRRRPADMAESVVASADTLYWHDATKVYAAKL